MAICVRTSAAKTEHDASAAATTGADLCLIVCGSHRRLLFHIQIICFARKWDGGTERRSPGSGGSQRALLATGLGVSRAPPGRPVGTAGGQQEARRGPPPRPGNGRRKYGEVRSRVHRPRGDERENGTKMKSEEENLTVLINSFQRCVFRRADVNKRFSFSSLLFARRA